MRPKTLKTVRHIDAPCGNFSDKNIALFALLCRHGRQPSTEYHQNLSRANVLEFE